MLSERKTRRHIVLSAGFCRLIVPGRQRPAVDFIFIIANYVMSKLMVFKKQDMVDYNSEEEKESSGEEEANA